MRVLIFGLMTLGTSVLADDVAYTQACVFTVECMEQEACAQSAYEVRLEYSFTVLDGTTDDGAGSGTAQDDSQDRRLVVTHSNGAFVANAIDFTSNSTITPEIYTVISSAEGDARLITAFPDAPMVITYHGTCQGQS